MKQNNYRAIGLTWCIPKNHRKQFEKSMEHTLMPKLTEFYSSTKIVAVLPFRHKSLKGSKGDVDTSWIDYWVVLVSSHTEPNEIWQVIKNIIQEEVELQDRLLRAEILRPQPHMDMYYPRIGGVKRKPVWHVMEYVVSKRETQAEYYNDQYTFSAPLIRHFWEANAIERMIGFERERFLEDKGGLPKWDVIHITGFKPYLLGKIVWHLLRFLPTFNSYARKIGYKSAINVLRSWDAKRIKYVTIAKQDPAYTLQLRNDY